VSEPHRATTSARDGAQNGGQRPWVHPRRPRVAATYLLDTHVLLWWLADLPRLSTEAREVIENESNALMVSAASIWEMSIKRTLGRLDFPNNLPEVLADANIDVLPITIEHTLAIGELPMHHHDPFDRMLIAQARVEGVTLISADPRFTQYDIAVISSPS